LISLELEHLACIIEAFGIFLFKKKKAELGKEALCTNIPSTYESQNPVSPTVWRRGALIPLIRASALVMWGGAKIIFWLTCIF